MHSAYRQLCMASRGHKVLHVLRNWDVRKPMLEIDMFEYLQLFKGLLYSRFKKSILYSQFSCSFQSMLTVPVNQLSPSYSHEVNPMRTTCRLVKWYTPPCIKPIREEVRKISLMCKFLVLHFQSFLMIG